MEMRQLRYFTVLAQELSFTRAAHKLHVSQPPLSFQIASLEEELGTRLFDRTSRSVQLSAAGAAFLPHARAVLERLEQARTQLARDLRPLPRMEIDPSVGDLFAFRYEHFRLTGYDPHPHIAAPVAV